MLCGCTAADQTLLQGGETSESKEWVVLVLQVPLGSALQSGSMQHSGWLEHWNAVSRIVQGGPEITEAEDQEDYKAEDDDAESEDLEVGSLPGLV